MAGEFTFNSQFIIDFLNWLQAILGTPLNPTNPSITWGHLIIALLVLWWVSSGDG